MIVIRPGETPCERSVALAMTAQSGVRALLDVMEAIGQGRMAALMMVLQTTLIEAGTIDVEGMKRLASAVSANVAAALSGDQSAVALDDMIEACEALEKIRAKHARSPI